MRVCLKDDASIAGTIVGELRHGDVLVQWDQSHERTRIARANLIALDDGDEPRSLELQLLDLFDRLRDGINLQLECATRDIQRIMKEKQ